MSTVPAGNDSTASAVSYVLQLLISSVKTLAEDLLLVEQNAERLFCETEKLRVMRSDVESAVRASGRLTKRAKAWMDSVDALSIEVDGLRVALDRSGTGCLCSWSCFKLARRAAEKLREARWLDSRGRDLGVLVGGHLPEYSSPILVGMERTLSAIRGHLSLDHVWILGIYGMGGCGKTTLLKKINNELLVAGRACPFDVLLWVTVSREPDIRRIQDAVGAKLGLHFSASEGDSNSSHEERARILFRALTRRKFLLLLDDLWAPLDLMAIGIPHPTSQRYSKIAFTSRSLQVCSEMDADVKVRVGLLDMEESWRLFEARLGTKVNLMSPPIRSLAQRIVEMCGGLPLALVVVGRAMAGARTANEWKHAVLQLTGSAEEIRGMDQVLSTLKLSYDSLPDESLRQCLSYCSLFPEGHRIPVEELIDCWVGEGLLDDPRVPDDDIDATRNRGRFVVERLKSASLLEKGAGEDGDMYVEMHDIIRDMASWISSKEERSSLLLTHRSISRLRRSPDVVRIAMTGGDQIGESLSEFPRCSKLLTLLFNRNSGINRIPVTFFSLMPALRVLDLSGTKIRELPEEIGLLTELRYLNLSDTFLRSLPTSIGRLVNLEQLDLRHTIELVRIPRAAISCLTRLQKLDLYNSGYCWPEESDEDRAGRGISLKDLGRLPRLNDLRLVVRSSPLLIEISGSPRLSRSMRYLTLQHIKDLPHLPPPDFNAMYKLRELCIDECSGLQELTFSSGERCSLLEVLSFVHLPITKIVILETSLQSLEQLHILGCHALKDLTSVHQLPRLQCIDLRACNGLEVLISSAVDDDSTILPQLKKINLYALANFKCISHRPLFLPRLEHLEVYGCPMFTKLPLDSLSVSSIKQIVGTRKWWDTLQWDDDGTRPQLLPIFKDPWQEEEREQEQEEQDQEDEVSGSGERSDEDNS